LGRQILERLIKDVEAHSIVEFRPRQEGNTLHAILAPKKVEPGSKPKQAAQGGQPRPAAVPASPQTAAPVVAEKPAS